MRVAVFALALVAFLVGFFAPVPEVPLPDEPPPDLAAPDLVEPARPKVCEANRATRMRFGGSK